MRKYRAWHKKYKKMYRVIGWIEDDYGQLCVYCKDEYGVTERFADGLAELMQFTGMTDRLGKEIFEGDIVQRGYFALNDVSKFGPEPWNHLPEGVKENDITTILEVWAVASDISGLQKISEAVRSNPDVVGVEVIGNIYENPEMISGEAFVR